MNTSSGQNHRFDWLLGSGISVGIAAVLIFVFRGSHRSLLAPIVFILVIIPCARYFGLLAGMVGSVAATFLFAIFLYEPYGDLRVNDRQALSNLLLLLISGLALSYANSERKRTEKPPHLKSH